MTLHSQINSAYKLLTEQLNQAKLLLLHPASRYRSVLIAKLVNDPAIPVFYYAMGPDDLDINAFIAGLTHDLMNQHPTFGRHLNMLPASVFENPEDSLDILLETFTIELAEFSDEPFVFVLDEYDRSNPADDIQKFVERLLDWLPPNCRIVINSRTMPRLPWIALIARGDALVLRDHTIVRDEFYRPKADEVDIEVFALGPGYVLQNGKLVNTWEGHLPRLLLFFALDQPIITRSEICRAFWPDLTDEQAVNVFHVTKRRLHKALDTEVLIHEDGFYRFNPDIRVYYDLDEFTSNLLQGRNEEKDYETRLAAMEWAVKLYDGPYLQGHDDLWAQERRKYFRFGFAEAIDFLAQDWLKQGRKEQALLLYLKALKESPEREDIHRIVMQLYQELGRRSEAVAHYRALAHLLEQEKREPEPETQAVYEQILG
ncbi:MAG: hypothetical protein D6712_11810 [Chloroflexi bacterium]|nr:MAG: hypothetical protein D6712_11810 [Chloroflexota bacterium]